MKELGVVRKIDGLGRLVIPKEIRKVLHIDIGTPIEFYMDGDGIMLKKHEPDNISEKVRELKSIVNDQIEDIGLDQCIAIEDELKKIEMILCASPS